MSEQRPVRVVHVLGRLSRSAGIQVVVRSLAGGVDPGLVQTHVVTARPWIVEDGLDEVGAVVHPLGHTRVGYRLWDRLRVMWLVAGVVRRVGADVVHVHSGTSWMGVGARLLCRGVGFVLEVHDAPGSGRHGRVTDVVEGWWGRFGGAVVVCHSSSVASEVRRRWRPRRLVMFPLAVDTGLFCPRGEGERLLWRERCGVPVGVSTLLLVVGRLAESKRFDRMVRVLAELGDPSVGLVVVGRGGQEERLRVLARELGVGDRVWFTGVLAGEELASAFGAGDVLCSPSEYEGFGLTLVEGMASGLAVAAVAVGGVTDIVVDGVTGRLVDPGRLEGLGVAVAELVADGDVRARWGVAGRERAVAEFGRERFIDNFVDVYQHAAT